MGHRPETAAPDGTLGHNREQLRSNRLQLGSNRQHTGHQRTGGQTMAGGNRRRLGGSCAKNDPATNALTLFQAQDL